MHPYMAEQYTTNNTDSLLGRLVVEKGLATSEEVQKCLEAQRKASEGSDPNQRSLAHLLISNGIITPTQVDRLRPEVEQQRAQQQIPGYQILSKLGAGAMATVYKARQLSLDRLVAIKVLPKKHTNNPQFVERFYAEGRAAAKLNHPNIVGALDVGKAGEYHYFVMEYVQGHTVYDDIVNAGPYSEENAIQIAIKVCKALDHAHKAGFIHRDVKPKNIMIASDGNVKLADMGLARAVSDREAAEAEKGKAYGTPYYISPEQIRGEEDVDFRADIYSFGATLYHMITGRVPFDGPNPSTVMHKHLKDDLVPPDHINEKLTGGISEIVEVCMARDKKDRYENTADLLQDLNDIAQGNPPLQARRRFDTDALSSLEATDQELEEEGLVAVEGKVTLVSLMHQPLFWAALGGWLVVVLLIILLLARVA